LLAYSSISLNLFTEPAKAEDPIIDLVSPYYGYISPFIFQEFDGFDPHHSRLFNFAFILIKCGEFP